MRRRYTPTFLLTAILMCSLVNHFPSVTALELYDHDLDGETISQGGSLDVNLGQVNSGEMISILFSASEDVDVVLLTESQYNNWNGQNYIVNGSEISTSIVVYTLTVESTNNYWVIIDNSNKINGGANSGQEVTISYGHIDISDPVFGEFKSRLFIEPNSYFHYDFGIVSQGDVLDMSISCEDWISHDLDIFLVQEENREGFLNGQDYWDRNATILDSCLEIWDFQLTETGNWHVFIENGPRGEATTDQDGILVDVFFLDHENLPTVIQSTTRMIEISDVWRVNLGNLNQNEILSFTLSISNEIFADIDVLIMESSEADKYVLGQQVTVLGHASLINTGSLETWDYTFPDSGTYSLIIDNSESPEGGASENKALQVEINVQEVTMLGDWVGWYQSRHYVEDGSFVSFDLGSLEPGDEIYYTVSGTSFGSGFLSSFDMMVMTGSQYSIYSSGGNPEIIEEASDLDTWISIFQDYTVETSDNYWVVIDAADGPNGGANSNGAWSFDYTIKSSRNQITSPQVKDSNYQMIATHSSGTNLVDQVDTSDNGNIDDNSDTNNQQSQDSGQTNIGDAQSKSDDDFGGAGSLCVGLLVLIVVVVVVRRRRSGSKQAKFISNKSVNAGPQTQVLSNYQVQQPSSPSQYGSQQGSSYSPNPPQLTQYSNQEAQTLSPGHLNRMNAGGTQIANQVNSFVESDVPPMTQMGYLGADGYYWIEWPSGTNRWYHRTENGSWTPLENKPGIEESGIIDKDGYEWIVHSDGTNWYRAAYAKGEWTKFDS